MGVTISITLPEPLENKLRLCAKEKGVSRSRFIGEILSKWEEDSSVSNNCVNQTNGYCRHFEIPCRAPQFEAETCSGYHSKIKEKIS